MSILRGNSMPNALEKLKSRKELFYYFVFFVIIFLFHLFFANPFNDDSFFLEHSSSDTLFGFLKLRYETWTSRLLLETLIYFAFKANLILWKFFDSIFLTGIVYYISRLSVPAEKKNLSFLAILYCFLIPVKMLNSAGWVTTTITYSWAFFSLFPSLYLFKMFIERKNPSVLRIILTTFALFFAVNNEQILALNIGFSIFLFLVYARTGKIEKKAAIYLAANLLISFASLVFVATCPGNYERNLTSIKVYFPIWNYFSFFEKCHMGFLSIFSYFFGIREVNFILIPLLAVLTIKSFKKNIIDFSLMLVMDIFILIFGYGLKFLSIVSHKFHIEKLDFGWLQNKFITQMSEFSTFKIAVETSIFALLAIFILIEIFRLSKSQKSAIVNVVIVFGGFCSAFILSFSPTVYASGIRTFMCFSAAIIITTLRLGFEKSVEESEAEK